MSLRLDPSHPKERQFYGSLNKIFVGQASKGDSGFAKLIAIKRGYFKKLLSQFQQDVDHDERITTSFREEFFDKLYSFFDTYFSETGSVLFQRTPAYKRIYEKIYTDKRDVMLFYKTRMLYYVKSEPLYKDMDVRGEGADYRFVVGDMSRIANEKKALVFTYEGEEKTDSVIRSRVLIGVAYAEKGAKGAKTNLKDLAKQANTDEADLTKAIKTFNRQTEMDFFINKDAKAFLNEQLKLTINKILTNEENKFTLKRIEQLQALQEHGQKLIAFVGQFEEELCRIWKKPKFARNSHYVITLGKVAETSPKLVDDWLGMKIFPPRRRNGPT